MALKGRQLRWLVKGVTEALDGSSAFPGAMLSLSNLIPDPRTPGLWIARPASQSKTTFSGFTSPAAVSVLFVLGNIAYGLIGETSGTYNGKDVPFALNLLTDTFETIAIPGGAASLPTSQPTTGDWTPPTIDIIGSQIVFTHPGFAGVATGFFFGWFDISGFSDATHTGSTHTNTTVDTLSGNVLQAAWKPGMTITDSAGDIPANTWIKSIAADGLSLVLSQAATGSNAATTFTVTGGTATAPLYAAGNTNGNSLAEVPLAVKNFNGRAYYSVPGSSASAPSNGLVFSDSGNPLQVTNATQAIKFNNGLNVTAFGGLPMFQTTGGILQSLVCFQGDSGMQQVTGDEALTNNPLQTNALAVGVGTLSPNAICNTPAGLAFVAPDGLRIVDFSAFVSPPIGDDGRGIQMAFLKTITPSRTVAAYNQNVMRISLQNGNAVGQPVQEYWYDFTRKIWSGPHTFPASIIAPYQLDPQHGFLLAPSGINAALFTSTVQPGVSDTFVENNAQMTWTWGTVLLPDNETLSMNAVVETALACQIPALQQWTVVAIDDHSNLLDQVTLSGSSMPPSIWGSFVWGAPSVWGAIGGQYFEKQLYWHLPLVVKQMTLQVTGESEDDMTIGPLRMRYEELGYLLPVPN